MTRSPFGACGACLSRDRALAALRPALLGTYSTLLALPASAPAAGAEPGSLLSCEPRSVCWECSALLRRISLFQQRALAAQLTLLTADLELDNDAPSLSRLGVALKTTYDVTCQHSPDRDGGSHIKIEDVVKREVESAFEDTPESCASDRCMDGADGDEGSLGSLAPVSEATRKRESARNDKVKAKAVCPTTPRTKTPKLPAKRRSKYLKRIESLQQKNSELKLLLSRDERGKKVVSAGVARRYQVVELSEEAMRRERARRGGDARGGAAWRCRTCLVGFASGDLLVQHNETSHMPKQDHSLCDVCEAYVAVGELVSHRSAHRLQYRCLECGHTDITVDSILRHTSTAHKPARCFKCKHCEKEFNSPKKLRYHRQTVHVEPVQCGICNRNFKWKPNLDKHMLQHSGGLPRLPCSICGKTYAGKHGLQIHMKLHASSDELHRCADCDIIFNTEYQLQVHLRGTKKHAGKKWYKHQCSECSKKFISESQLKHHFDYKHMGKYLHSCKVCGRGYATLTGLHRHVKTIHEQQETPKTCVCETCGRAFKSNRQLHHHKLIHSGERPYTCDVCGANFRQTSALYTHRRLVHLKIKQTKKKAALLAN